MFVWPEKQFVQFQMAENPAKTEQISTSLPSNVSTQPIQPLVKIGHYILGETLGVGTFGKVKSKKTGTWFNM